MTTAGRPQGEEHMKSIGIGLLGVVGLLGLVWVLQGNDFFLYKAFAPRYEQTRRQVFEQSKAYNQGMIQELQNMQFEYEQADAAHRAALGSIILHRAADYDEARLPSDLQTFIAGLRRERVR
jgi:hypothetical protein